MSLPSRSAWLLAVAAALVAATTLGAYGVPASAQTARKAAAPKTSFVVEGDHLALNGQPFQVLSGEMHYARIPREYWRARMRMAKAMGLNTIATYVFWNVHEPQPGVYDFSGNNDLVAFIKTADEEGLHVLLRAGPYACAEWEFGGFPAWLLADPKMSTALRTNDPAFMQPVERWIQRLAQQVAPLQIEHGGPVIAVQIENEYGNFSNDHAYMAHMRDVFVRAGFNAALLYTVDPSKSLAQGDIPGVFAGVNFGTGNAEKALTTLANFRPGQPLFATEYWPGWFDLWGHPHETRPIAPQLADLDYMLSHHASVNIYMVHGGTSFGSMAGASQSTGNYRGNVTSYDYDAPIDEAGHPTAKFFAYRDLILKYTHDSALPVPPVAPVVALPAFTLQQSVAYDAKLPQPMESATLRTMEDIGQACGYILYRTRIAGAVHDAPLVLDPVHDFAQVYLDGKLVGSLDRHYRQTTVTLTTEKSAQLDILVENTGRLNSTKHMRDEWKGLRNATLAGTPLRGWQIYSLPMQASPEFAKRRSVASGAHYAWGSFQLGKTGDTFLDISQLGKGLIWINGHALGRFWNIGPQQTLYVPAPWLKVGKNVLSVFDMMPASAPPTLVGRMTPILAGPTPGYDIDPERTKKPAADAEFGPKLAAPASPAPKP